MNMHVSPLRLAVMFDGDQGDIRNMAKDAVGQLAETAKSLGRSVLVKGAQTMDVARGGVVNWSNWVSPEAFDQDSSIRLAHCYRSNSVLLGALHPLAIENENLSRVDALCFPPRLTAEKIDAVLIATGRDRKGISDEFKDMFQLDEILNGSSDKTARRVELQRAKQPSWNDGLACTPPATHGGLVKQGTRVYSLATILGVEQLIQDKLSQPTKGASFHGTAGDVKHLVEAMAITLADPDSAPKRLADNRFGRLLAHNRP